MVARTEKLHGPSRPCPLSVTQPNTVALNDEVLEADKVFINVGGRASVPEMPGIDDVSFLTNSSMMDVDFLPKHLVIVGGSYVGLEFGQMYRRFGSEDSHGALAQP